MVKRDAYFRRIVAKMTFCDTILQFSYVTLTVIIKFY